MKPKKIDWGSTQASVTRKWGLALLVTRHGREGPLNTTRSRFEVVAWFKSRKRATAYAEENHRRESVAIARLEFLDGYRV